LAFVKQRVLTENSSDGEINT